MARGDIQITNPAQKWFKWSGSTGTLSYYDKETKENVEVETPFTFLLLDTFTTIKGYDESAKSGIYSNEVKDTTKQVISVKCGQETICTGLYKDIRDTAIARGGSYAQSCYIAYKEGDELVIGNIMMTGSSFGGGVHKPADKNMKDIEVGAWLAFTKANQATILEKAIMLEGKNPRICTNGATKFYAPKFKIVETTPETDKKAIELTQKLKAYMAEYFKKDLVADAQVEKEIATDSQETVAEIFPPKKDESKFEDNAAIKTFDTLAGSGKKVETVSEAISKNDVDELPF